MTTIINRSVMKTATVMNFKCQCIGLSFTDANDSDATLSSPMPPTAQRYFHESPAIMNTYSI